MTDLNAQGSGPVRIASDKLRWDLRVYCKVHGILGVGRDSNGEFSMTAFCPDCGSDKTTETFGPVADLQSKLSAVQAKASRLREALIQQVQVTADLSGADDWKGLKEARHALAAYQAGTGEVDTPSSEGGKQVDAKETKP